MPIEIRELLIRATVEPDASKTGSGCGPTPPGGKSTGGAAPGTSNGGGRDLVQDCVREVLRILDARKER
ncbi:MAG: DUF5908 family protein [Methylotetracoccus sp.]